MKSINVGLIGIGPNWWTRYEPVVRSMRERICIRAVFDHVTIRAESVAASFKATAVGGVLALVDRTDVDAVLVLNPDWHEHALLDFICSKGKPVYLGVRPVKDLLSIDQLHTISILTGTPVMPEFDRRYEPATNRLQELLASRLGRPRRITIRVENLSLPHPTEAATANQGTDTFHMGQLVELFDWCGYIARTPPANLLVETENIEASQIITVRFHQPKSGDKPVSARIELHHRESPSPPSVSCHIDASCGSAEFSSQELIRWKSDDGCVDEELSHDRGAVEVMLDHFCRRVVGGLIPVPDLGDVCNGLRLVQAAADSLRNRTTIEFARGM